jgi:GNAT superfamily N-acetyltransferase
MVREWDPRTASPAEFESLLDALNAGLAADLPEDPLWQNSALREYQTATMPGERRISWVAEEEPGPDGAPGRLLGHTNILLLRDIGVVELFVHPSVRRSGMAHELLAKAVRRAYDEGFSAIGVEVVEGTPAVAFYSSLGFVREYVETRSVLTLSTVDWLALGEMARSISNGYRIEFYPGGPPDDLLEAYAMAKSEVRDIDDGDLDLRPSSYDPQRLRDSLACLHKRGMKPYIVMAIHERTGAVAGLTEVVVPAQRPTRADQYDTIVVSDHRGYGIDRAIKARMLFELRSAEPRLIDVQTWNALDNEPMLKVNAELGFEPDREWYEYGADVAELLHLLDPKT